VDIPGADALRVVLEEAQRLGFLGPGDVGAHLTHSLAFVRAAETAPRRFLDLGSGGGVPGLVLAHEWPATPGVLLDAGERRAAFLGEACDRLGYRGRIEVVHGRAEDAARRAEYRGGFDLVTARGFGPPPVTAECGVGFLAPGGLLVVSEPPEHDAERWPAAELAELGLGPAVVSREGGASLALMRSVAAVADRWPRRTGVPAKRPLWRS
jgi:16S rRNA (guanine527-N7)-methyltransferase